MTDDLIPKIATAIWGARHVSTYAQARAALAVLADPSEAMLDAGGAALQAGDTGRGNLLRAWRVMIEEARNQRDAQSRNTK